MDCGGAEWRLAGCGGRAVVRPLAGTPVPLGERASAATGSAATWRSCASRARAGSTQPMAGRADAPATEAAERREPCPCGSWGPLTAPAVVCESKDDRRAMPVGVAAAALTVRLNDGVRAADT